MNKLSNIIIMLCLVLFSACSGKKTQVVPLGDFPALGDFPIGINDIPNAVFTYPSPQIKFSWYSDLNSVLDDDVVLKIVRCDSKDYIVCILFPYPIFLPKKTTNTRIFIHNSHTYTVTMSLEKNRDLKPLSCDNSSFWVKVTNKTTNTNYWYWFNKDKGLAKIITFEKGQNVPEIPSYDLYLLEGNVFTFDEICKKAQ